MLTWGQSLRKGESVGVTLERSGAAAVDAVSGQRLGGRVDLVTQEEQIAFEAELSRPTGGRTFPAGAVRGSLPTAVRGRLQIRVLSVAAVDEKV